MTTAITNALIYTVDPAFNCYNPGTIVFDDSRILAVGPTATTTIPEGAETIDGRGRLAVLPGLIDAHTHSSLLKGFRKMPS